jgi:hypothetical protein
VYALLVLPLAIMVGAGLFAALRSRAVFVVRIRRGQPRAARGQVTRGFLQDIGEACTRHGVLRGSIRGVAAGNRINLVFSGDIPAPCRQQIRNLWGVCGWSASAANRPRRTV